MLKKLHLHPILIMLLVSTLFFLFAYKNSLKIIFLQEKKDDNEKIQEPTETEKLLARMTIEEKVGQMFMFGFEGTSPTKEIENSIKDNNLGGIILFGNNVSSRVQLINLIDQLQKDSSESKTEQPLFIAIDQEGGIVDRIKFTGVKEFTSQGDITSSEQAYDVGINRSKELRDLGINVNFSPVVEYVDDKNAFMYERVFHGSKDEIVNYASSMINGYSSNKLISCVKHFLGHPDTIDDPHKDEVIADFDQKEINLRAGIFKKIFKNSHPQMVMVSHVTYPEIDKDNPCSLSYKCINLLKKSADFSNFVSNGLIITDDLEMGAIQKKYGNKKAAVMAINAGNDILLYVGNPTVQNEAYNAVIDAVKTGEISEERIDESVLKILETKKDWLQQNKN